jgi:hypothetical protein
MKKTFSSLAILCLLGTGVQAYAQGNVVPAQINASGNTRAEVSLPKLPTRTDIKANRGGSNAEVEIKRASTTEMKDVRKDARASSSELRKEVRASTTAARKDARRENAEKIVRFHGDLMVRRFNAAVDRFEKIIVRIDSRIAKLKAEGKVTTEAEKFQADGKVSIAIAKTSIATIPDLLASALAQNTLTGSFGDLEKVAVGIRTNLLSAQKSLLGANESLRELSVGGSASSTTSANEEAQ